MKEKGDRREVVVVVVVVKVVVERAAGKEMDIGHRKYPCPGVKVKAVEGAYKVEAVLCCPCCCKHQVH